MATMRAWNITNPGSLPGALNLVSSATRPSFTSSKPGQILVRVSAAAINPADYKVPQLGLLSRAAISYPKTPGMDFSGRVAELGPQPSGDVSVGDFVMGRIDPMAQQGTLAEYVVADADGYVKLPESAGVDKAAGAPTVAATAYQAIVGNVKAGDKIFVNGGSGGVGTCAIQVGKALGCHVTVSCSTGKIDLCKSLGADDVIDYKTQDVLSALTSRGANYFSLVIDVAANNLYALYSASKAFLAPGCKYTLIGGSPSLSLIADFFKVKLVPGFLGGGKHEFVFILTKNEKATFQQLADWMGDGKLDMVVDSTYEFEDAGKAYEKLKEGSSTGKIVVRVANQ
jgi:NADPH:quinone reductase-like Zn-dependent oxidoreductase